MGLILGSLPIVFKQAEIKKISFLHILCATLTLSFSLYLSLLENTTITALHDISNSKLILCGILASARNCCSWR